MAQNSRFVRKARNIFLAGLFKKNMAAVLNCWEGQIVKNSPSGNGLVYGRMSRCKINEFSL